MPRFALLKHETPPGYLRGRHYDLLLESGTVCRTWALTEFPLAGESVNAEILSEHRLHYLDYEGAVTGGRGHVTRVDWGSYRWLIDEPGNVAIDIEGERLKGRLAIVAADDTKWVCHFEPN